MFDSLFGDASTTTGTIELMPLMVSIAVSLVLGFVLALAYSFRSKHTKSFVTTLAVLPSIVCVVIAMVNGNVGAGVAVAGAFSLVRFRSAPGSARDIAYIFLAAVYGWKYIVLFEMDEKEIAHIQMPKQFDKAQAMGWVTALAGLAGKSLPAMGAGVLAASKNSSTSVFADVKEVKGVRQQHTIRVNQMLNRNQVYADDPDYDFVWNFITGRCPQAKIH